MIFYRLGVSIEIFPDIVSWVLFRATQHMILIQNPVLTEITRRKPPRDFSRKIQNPKFRLWINPTCTIDRPIANYCLTDYFILGYKSPIVTVITIIAIVTED
jgi:hypothetical protein